MSSTSRPTVRPPLSRAAGVAVSLASAAAGHRDAAPQAPASRAPASAPAKAPPSSRRGRSRFRRHRGDAVARPRRPVRQAVVADAEAHQLAPADLPQDASLPLRRFLVEQRPQVVLRPLDRLRLPAEEARPGLLARGRGREQEGPRLRGLLVVPLAERGRAEGRAPLGRVGEDVDRQRVGEVRGPRAAAVDLLLGRDEPAEVAAQGACPGRRGGRAGPRAPPPAPRPTARPGPRPPPRGRGRRGAPSRGR